MKKIFLGITVFFLLFLAGCGANELENSAFPLVIGIAPEENEKFGVYMAYPDLQDSKARENAMSTDAFWQGNVSDLFDAMDTMSENSSKNVDLNQLKILILDKSLMESPENCEQVIAFFQENREAAWNSYVLLTDGDMEKIFSEDLEIQTCLGLYLEDLIEEWTDMRAQSKTVVGDLMSQYYNRNETILIPVVRIEGKKPAIEKFEAVKDLTVVSELPTERAYEVMLLQNQLKQYSFPMDDGTRIKMQTVRVERSIDIEENGSLVINITIKGIAEIENRLLLSEEEQTEICRQAEQQLEQRLLRLAEEQKEKYRYDVTNSFLLLAGYNRDLWQEYGADRESYEADLQYRIEVKLTNR